MAAWSTIGTIRGSQGLLAPLGAQGPDETKRRAPRCITAPGEAGLTTFEAASTAGCPEPLLIPARHLLDLRALHPHHRRFQFP